MCYLHYTHFQYLNSFILFCQGRMQDFSGRGGATLKFLGFWIYMPRISGMSRAAKLRTFARGIWGHAPPKKIFKNGAISCVLRAIFNHFHDKKSSQIIINKMNFFTDHFIMLLPHLFT